MFLFWWVLLQAQYLLVLCSFKEQLQQHVRVHAVEAVVACREIENTLQALTGPYPFYTVITIIMVSLNLLSNNHVYLVFDTIYCQRESLQFV